MLYNYLKISLRSIFKNKFFTSINLLGLTLSLGAALLIFLYASHELGYDKFHAKSDRLYQVTGKMNHGGLEMQMTGMSATMAPALIENDIRVKNAVRMLNPGKTIVKNEQDDAYFVDGILFADASFEEMFDFQWLQGDPSELNEPGTVILTEKMALQYFGTTNAMGKTLYYDRKYPLVVSGIIEETPSNSSISYDMIASFETIRTIDELKGMLENENVQLGSFHTFVELESPSDKETVEGTIAKLTEESPDQTFVLENIESLYLGFGFGPQRIYLYALLLVGVLIVVLALLNYINLTIARSTARGREVGIRKVNGASRRSLVFQFFLDSFLIISAAFAMAFVLLVLIRPYMSSFMDQPLDTEYLQNPLFLCILSVIFIGSVMIAGSYPAYVMSNFNPVKILKGSRSGSGKNSWLQKSFTTFQFMVSIALLLSTLVIIDQLKFLKNQEIGLDKDQILAVNLSPNKDAVGFEYMKNEIGRVPGISGVSVSSLSLFKGGYSIYFTTVPGTDEEISLSYMNVDEQFAELLGIEFATRFSEIPLTGSLLANEAAAEKLHISADSGATELALGRSARKIAGITNDFNYSSLKNKIEPMVMRVYSDTARGMIDYGGSLYVKMDEGSDVKETMAAIQSEVDKFQPDAPFEYYFVDDAFNDLYVTEDRMATLLTGFTFLAILIAGMGLLGMITFNLERRVREIGIRKVLGASGQRIITMMISEYAIIFLISALLAVPLAWWAMEQWLVGFSYRIDIAFAQPAIAVMITLLVGIATIVIRTWTAAKANPVDSLKLEG